MMSTDPNQPIGITFIAMKTIEDCGIPMACPCTGRLEAKNCRQMGGRTNRLKAEARSKESPISTWSAERVMETNWAGYGRVCVNVCGFVKIFVDGGWYTDESESISSFIDAHRTHGNRYPVLVFEKF